MPRASWRGFLRLSLVSCPIYLSPAASRTKPIRLRQVWGPGLADEGDQSPQAARPEQVTEPSLPDLGGYDGGYDADQPQPVTRVTIRPHDPRTGEEIDKAEVVKGYEYGRGPVITPVRRLSSLTGRASKSRSTMSCAAVVSVSSGATTSMSGSSRANFHGCPPISIGFG